MDFTGWPIWAILALLLLTNQYTIKFLNQILVIFGIASAKREEGELEAERWMRARADWSADKAFDILEKIINDFQTQSEARDKTMIDLISIVQKNTEAVRLLAQKIIKAEESVASLIETQHLRRPAND